MGGQLNPEYSGDAECCGNNLLKGYLSYKIAFPKHLSILTTSEMLL